MNPKREYPGKQSVAFLDLVILPSAVKQHNSGEDERTYPSQGRWRATEFKNENLTKYDTFLEQVILKISQDLNFDGCTTFCSGCLWKRGKAGNVEREKQTRLAILM